MKNAKDNKKKNGSIKKIIAAILILVVIVLMSKKSDAAALPMLPALPYVPPSRVQIWDLLNNMFGLTKLNISDEQKRLAAYEELLGRYIAQEDIEEIVQKAREARKMQIKAGVRDGLQQYMLHQVQTGVEEIITADVVGAQETYNALMTWNKINSTMLPYSTWQTFSNNANARYGINGWVVYALYAKKNNNNEATIVIAAVTKAWNMAYVANTPNDGSGGTWYRVGYAIGADLNCIQIRNNYDANTTNTAINWSFNNDKCICTTGGYYGSNTRSSYTGKGTIATRKATAQNAAITTALQNSSDIPLTANSQVVNGVLDTTGDIVTTLPATLPQAASDIQDLPAVQEQLGVLPAPISQDIEQSITQLQEQQVAQYGDAGEYAIDLTQLFPFCLPFDIYRILVAFEAEPETPQIHFELVNPWSNGENAEKWEAELDLSRFDGVAALVRKLELLLYCVGLAMITRQVFLRG